MIQFDRSKVTSVLAGADIPGAMGHGENNAYLRASVMTATPEQLQLMLYDGAIRFALQGRDAVGRKDFEESFNKLTRAQNIVLEMQSGLNYDVNRPLCERMASIYNFIYRKLVDANVNRNVADVDDALKVLRIERGTWQLLVDKVGKMRGTESEPLPVAPFKAPSEPVLTFSAEA